MRIISVVFIVPIMRLFNYHDKSIIKSQDRSSISTIGSKKIFSREKINITMLFNKYKNRNNYECFYCLGNGYIECDVCSKPSYCCNCEYTGFKKCHICGGSGKGGPRYNFIPIMETSLFHKGLLHGSM